MNEKLDQETEFLMAKALLYEQFEALTMQSVLTDEEERWCDAVEDFLNRVGYTPLPDDDE